MKKYNLLLALLVSSSFALTIDEAIQIALDKNFALQEQKELLNESKENISLKKAPFLPIIDLTHSYGEKDKTANFQLKKDHSSSATISYNLFKGFANYEDLQSTKHLYSASKFYLKAKKEDTILDVKTSYITYLKAMHQKRTYEEAYKLFSKQYDDAKERHSQGLLSKNNLLQIDVNRLDAKQNVLIANKDLQLAKASLSNLLGGKEINSIDDIESKELFVPEYSSQHINKRSEIQAIKSEIQSLESLINVQKSAFYPTIDLSASLSKYYENRSGTGMEIFPEEQRNILVNASWRIYQGGKNFDQIEIFKRQRAQKNAKLSQLLLDIQLQLDEAVLNYELANNNHKTSTVALEQAEENYKIISIRYKEGLDNTTNVIDANYLLINAKQRYFNSYYDKFLAIETIKRVLELHL